MLFVCYWLLKGKCHKTKKGKHYMIIHIIWPKILWFWQNSDFAWRGRHWQMEFFRCAWILGKFWQFWANFGILWQLLGAFCHLNQLLAILATVGFCHELFVTLGNWWQLVALIVTISPCHLFILSSNLLFICQSDSL